MLAVSTLGVLYIVEKGGETVTDIKSLAGKTIYATGKGATPEYALTYLLARNGLELGKDVNVEWKSEPTEIVAQMAAQDSAVAMLPQGCYFAPRCKYCQDICRTVTPENHEVSPGHCAACHFPLTGGESHE